MAKIYYGNQRIDGREIGTNNIVDEAITNEKIADEAITNEKIADDAISTSKVQDGSITENKLSAEVQEKLNREVGITDYDDLDDKPVINVKIESETDLYTGLKDAENGMMIRATTVPAEYITDNTLYEADSHWYLRFIPLYTTYDEAEHRFTLIDQCVETYTVPGHDFDTVVGKLASGTIVVNGQTESVALSLSQATDHDTGEILIDGLILTGNYQDHPEDVPEYQILFNSYIGTRTAELTLNYDVEFDTIIDQNVLDQIVSVTLEQNGYYIIDALNARDGLGFNEVLDKTKLKTINGTSVVGSGDVKVTTFQPFKSSWPVSSSYTASDFCQAVNDDADATVGMAYLGGAKWSGMPAGISNGDVVVEILQGPNANTKSIHLIMTSGSVAPYTWEYTWWSGSSPKGWVSFKSSIVAGNNIRLSDDSQHRLVVAVDSTGASEGDVLTADGQGGASWQTPTGGTIPEFEISLVEFYTLYQGGTITITDSDSRYDIINNNDTIKFKREETGTQPKWEIIANKELNGKNTIGFTFVDYDSTTDKVINYFIAFIPDTNQYTVMLIQKQDENITYSAGNGLALTGTEFSVDTTVIATQQDLTGKQDTLVSGTNIKTINNESILGSGNIDISIIDNYNDLNNIPIFPYDGKIVARKLTTNDSIYYGDKVHFDTSKWRELNQLLYNELHDRSGGASWVQITRIDSQSSLGISFTPDTSNDTTVYQVTAENPNHLIIYSVNADSLDSPGTFTNLDANGDFVISNGVATDINKIDYLRDEYLGWNGTILSLYKPATILEANKYYYDPGYLQAYKTGDVLSSIVVNEDMINCLSGLTYQSQQSILLNATMAGYGDFPMVIATSVSLSDPISDIYDTDRAVKAIYFNTNKTIDFSDLIFEPFEYDNTYNYTSILKYVSIDNDVQHLFILEKDGDYTLYIGHVEDGVNNTVIYNNYWHNTSYTFSATIDYQTGQGLWLEIPAYPSGGYTEARNFAKNLLLSTGESGIGYSAFLLGGFIPAYSEVFKSGAARVLQDLTVFDDDGYACGQIEVYQGTFRKYTYSPLKDIPVDLKNTPGISIPEGTTVTVGTNAVVDFKTEPTMFKSVYSSTDENFRKQTIVTENMLDVKQDVLVSGTNIKTINGNSILGSGDLVISGGGTGLYKHEIAGSIDPGSGSVVGNFVVISNDSTAYTDLGDTSLTDYTGIVNVVLTSPITATGQISSDGTNAYITVYDPSQASLVSYQVVSISIDTVTNL